MPPPPPAEEIPPIHDVLIIGAGPAGLAVAARLRERTPSALYTDEEHRRFHWLRKHGGGAQSIKDRKTGRVKPAHPPSSSHRRSLRVLDAEGPAWLTRWHGLFAAFRISHLRSPMFFHPDPSDRDALLAYAHASERTGELVEISGCVGKEVSKHRQKKRRRELCGKCGKQAMAPATVDERDRKDYFTPSAGMFGDFVEGVVGRYGLQEEGLVRGEKVEGVEYGFVDEREAGFLEKEEERNEKLFTVQTSTGVHFARTVVLAVGAGNAPCIPPPINDVLAVGRPHEAACHALTMRGDSGLPDLLRRKVAAGKRTNVLVVGGGLTSAQIGDLALRQGVSKVWHLTRGPLKVKPFDIDLNWMSKFRNQEKAAFWMADDDEVLGENPNNPQRKHSLTTPILPTERAEMLREARGGGSITPNFSRILQKHIASGRTSLHTNTTLTSQTYNPTTQQWNLTTCPPLPTADDDGKLPPIDHIYLATGVQSDISTLPYLRSIVEQFPLETHDGLPALTDDLAWRDDVPLFVAGKFAGLRLGPGAANLEGARAGAERIVLAVEKVLGGGAGEG
ncbi:hypothetical protein Q7P37_001568 [Cladosporium fusiforme]